MIVLVLVAVAAALVAVVAYAYRAKHQQNTPEELRGDWWPQFEAQFRNYVRRCDRAKAQRGRREHPLRQQRFPRGPDVSF
jgi:hypothetical protein